MTFLNRLRKLTGASIRRNALWTRSFSRTHRFFPGASIVRAHSHVPL